MVLYGPAKWGNLRATRPTSDKSIPHSTGAAKAIGLVTSNLNSKLQSHTQLVTVVDGFITELTAIIKEKVTVEEVNNILMNYTDNNPSLEYDDRHMVLFLILLK